MLVLNHSRSLKHAKIVLRFSSSNGPLITLFGEKGVNVIDFKLYTMSISTSPIFKIFQALLKSLSTNSKIS